MDGTGTHGDGSGGRYGGQPDGQPGPDAVTQAIPVAQALTQPVPQQQAPAGWAPHQTGSAWGQQPGPESAQAPTQAFANPYAQQPHAQQQASANPYLPPQGQQQPANPYLPPQQQAQPPQSASTHVTANPYLPPPQTQAPRDGLTPNPFALPGQNAYAGYQSAPQAQPPNSAPADAYTANPYAPHPLGTNADARRDDQTFLQRTGLSKGRAVWLVVLLVVAGGFFVYNKFFSTSPDGAKVGSCVHNDGSAYDLKTVSCGDPAANAKVVARFDGDFLASKCDQYAAQYPGVIAFTSLKPTYVLCLDPTGGAAGSGPSAPAPASS